MPCSVRAEDDGKRSMVDHCSGSWLAQQLRAGSDLLLLDCRPGPDFGAGHVLGAVHLLLPAILLRRLHSGKLSAEQVMRQTGETWHHKTLVLYDVGQSTANSTVAMLLKRIRKDGHSAFLLEGGYPSFKEKYPHMCSGAESSIIRGIQDLVISADSAEDRLQLPDSFEENNEPVPFPVEVLPGLFLGNKQVSEDIEVLNKHGILYVVNVTSDVPNHFEEHKQFHYLQIPITDNIQENLASYFPKANAFIDEARSAKSGVLVHCLAGISRSVTITVAYLMHSLNLTFNEAFTFVKRKKPTISPNFNFLGQLMDYQTRLRCSCPPRCSNLTSSSTTPPSGGGDAVDCSCSCHQSKWFFTSPTVMSCTSTSSTCTSSSLEFDYDVPPTPS